MRINIKEIINDTTEKNKHWLAEAVEGQTSGNDEKKGNESESDETLSDIAEEEILSEIREEVEALNEVEISLSAAEEAKEFDEQDDFYENEESEETKESGPFEEEREEVSYSERIDAAEEEFHEEEISAELNVEPEVESKVEPETEAKSEQEQPEEDSENLADRETPEEASLEALQEKTESRKKYAGIAGIVLAFVLLMTGTFAYMTMVPKTVNAVINGKEQEIETKEYTIEGFLEEEGIGFCDEDYISMPLTTYLYDGISFEIVHATDFQVTADGKTKKYKSLCKTVGEALKDCNIKVGRIDIVKPGSKEMLTDNMKVVVKRVIIKKQIVKEDIPFKIVEKEDPSLDEGSKKVIQKGKNGKAKVTYEIKYIDGKEASRKKVAKKVITPATEKIVAKGTRISIDGQSYSRKLVVKAYSYTGGGRTAMGTQARVGEIAVDPSVIPLGTNVYIEGVGPRRAEDTGGNIKGNTIDIYMNTQSECISWGVRYVTIYIQ